MSYQTRKESRERAKRFKKSGQKGTEAAMKFEAQDKAEGVVKRDKKKEKALKLAEEGKERILGAGLTTPAKKEEKKEESKGWFSNIWKAFNNWATWKEGSKMREDVTVSQVVEATMMGVGIAATGVAVAGVGVAAAASTAGAKLISSGGLSAAPVARAAAGELSKQVGKVSLRKVATNTVTAKKTVSFLGKLASTAKKPAFVLGALGAYAFGTQLAYNERGDTAMSLAIAARDAEKSGDMEALAEIQEMTDDLAHPDLLQTLTNFAPIINYPLSAIQKMRAAKYAVDMAIKRSQATEYKPTPLTEAKRLEEEAYYKEIEERRKEAKAADRKAEEKYWEELRKEKEERERQARKADEEYWEEIREANAAAKEEERRKEEEYWANIRARNK